MIKKKTKPCVLLGAGMLLFSASYGQSLPVQSVNSAGQKMVQSNGSLSFTVGELAILSQKDNQGNSLGSGFTSGATLTTLSVQPTLASVLDVKVYPNPTTDLLHLQINHSAIDEFVLNISDLQGKEMYNGKYAGVSNVISINTTTYANGIYMLSIKNLQNQLLGTYKIIKH